ncbi:MAG: hypothetical protein Tsb007_17060 [Rhizobacter sp.]
MATTVSITPADRNIAGAATDTATGSIDRALASEAFGGCACAVKDSDNNADKTKRFMFIPLALRAHRAGSWPA